MFGYIAAGVGLIVVLFFAAGWILSGAVLHPRRKSLEEAEKNMVDEGALAPGYYKSLPREPFKIETGSGTLSCELIPAGRNCDPARVAILMHGYGFNRMGEVKYIPFFRKRGFNIIIYDNRNSGESFKSKTTMGYFEKKDLSRVISWAVSRFGDGALIGLHGESMGGATVLMTGAEDERVSFVIADCPYDDCGGQLYYNLRSIYKLGKFPLMPLCSLFTKIRAGFYYSEVSPINAIKNIKRPLPCLFFHGTGDDFVLCGMTERMYEVYPGPKMAYYGKGSRHTRTSVDFPEEYDAAIGEFLETMVPEYGKTGAEKQ